MSPLTALRSADGCRPAGRRYPKCRTTNMAFCVVLFVLLCAAWVTPVSCATVNILDFVSLSDSPRAKNFMKGFKAVLQDNNNQLHSGDTVAITDPINTSDLVESLSSVATDNTVPLVLGPVTDEALLTLLNSDVTTSNHFVYLSPLTSSDLGLAYNPNVFFTQNTPLIQLAVMLNYLMAEVKASRVGVMYVAKPDDVDSQLALGPAEIDFMKKHWGDKINVLEVGATASTVTDADVSRVLENNPEAVFLFDRQGATPVTVDFFHKLITNAVVREKNIKIFAPYAASIPLVEEYTTAANNGEAVSNPNNVIFSTSNPVLLDNRFTFLQDFQNSMTSNGITDTTTGTTENVGLIEGWVAAHVLMDLYNQNYVNGMTREAFYNEIWNQNRYLIGKDFAEGPYAGACTAIMVEQQFTCDTSQGARTLLLNHIIASPTAGEGAYTLTPITAPSANLSFPVGTPITEETAGGYVTGSRSDGSDDDSKSSFPWWAILLCVLGALLLLLLLLLLLCCCCGWCCFAGCCKDKKQQHTGYENAPKDDKQKVTVVTLGVQHSDLLWDSQPKEMSTAMQAVQKMTRELIKKYHAYEATSSVSGDECTIVCQNPDDAVHLTHQLETRLHEYHWNTNALERTYQEIDRAERRGGKPGDLITPSTSPSSSLEREDTYSTGYQGPRVGLGVHTGYVDQIEKDEEGEYVYQGHTVMMSAQAEHQTQGSRVLVSQNSLDDLRDETRNEFDFIRTNLTVNNEAQQPVPLYELRTPITNQQEISGATRRRSPTPLTKEESEKPAYEEAVIHEQQRNRSVTPRLNSEERVEKEDKEDDDDDDDEIRVVTTKMARLTLMRAVEDEPHVDREQAVRRSELQATEQGIYEEPVQASREPSPPALHATQSEERAAMDKEEEELQPVRHSTPPLAALEADRYCGVGYLTPRDPFSASESQRHRTPTPEPAPQQQEPIVLRETSPTTRRRLRRASLHAREERAAIARDPVFTATEAVSPRQEDHHQAVPPLMLAPITTSDTAAYASARTAPPQSAREEVPRVDTHRTILTETEVGPRDEMTPRELLHTQYVTHVTVPDHLVARSEEPSKSKSPPPAGEEHQPSTTERPGTVVEPLFNLEDYRYPAPGARNEIGVQTSLASDRRRPIDQPNRYEEELNQLNERKKKSKRTPSIHYEHGFPTELGDKVVPCFSEGNGLLFRIIDSKTNTWSYYNDTTEFVMIATLTIGRRSQFEVLDNFRTVWNPTLRKYEGEVVIKPLQTVRVLRGAINGYSIAYAARLASEM